jgi:hypothetical protein
MFFGVDGASEKSALAIAGTVIEAYVRDLVCWQWFTEISQRRISFK